MDYSVDNKIHKKWFQRFGLTIRLASLLVLLLLLAFLSMITTSSLWDGAFPAGEFQLRIQNQFGQPIENATLEIFNKGTDVPAFKYPFDNYLTLNKLISDKNGLIVLLHKPQGLEFGGMSWMLFWFIPIDDTSPKYDLEIKAIGYKPFWISSDQIFEVAHHRKENRPTKVIQVNGYLDGKPYQYDREINIYTIPLTLKEE